MTIRHEVAIIAEGTTGKLTTTSDGSTVTLLDEDGNPIASADMNSITMTLIEVGSGSTVNSRSAQDVFDTNNCTYHATSGLFTWNMQIGDTSIVNSSTKVGGIEYHLATITFLWDSSASQLNVEILIPIRNLRSVS